MSVVLGEASIDRQAARFDDRQAGLGCGGARVETVRRRLAGQMVAAKPPNGRNHGRPISDRGPTVVGTCPTPQPQSPREVGSGRAKRRHASPSCHSITCLGPVGGNSPWAAASGKSCPRQANIPVIAAMLVSLFSLVSCVVDAHAGETRQASLAPAAHAAGAQAGRVGHARRPFNGVALVALDTSATEVTPGQALVKSDPGAPSIQTGDIVYHLVPWSLQSYRYSTLQCHGANRYWWQWRGREGRPTEAPAFPVRAGDGSLRAGVVADPADDNSVAFYLAVHPTDPDTSGGGNKRCEMSLGWSTHADTLKPMTARLPRREDFWWVVKFRLDDWRETKDRQVIWQWLAGDTTELGPLVNLNIWGKLMRLEIHSDGTALPSKATMTKTIPWTLKNWQPHHWYTMVVKANIDPAHGGQGKLVAWLDDQMVLDYVGPLGYSSASTADYAKFGVYHWTNNNSWDMAVPTRQAWFKGSALVRDRPGYQHDSMARLVNATGSR